MTEPATAGTGDTDERSYNGLFGAFPYALRSSDSRLFRLYVVVGGLVSALIAIAFVLALVKLLGETASAGAGVFTFSRSFFIVVGLAAVAPIIAPILSVARRHRRTGSTVGYDRAMAATGYLFVFSLYLLLVISAPEDMRDPAADYGVAEPIIAFFYSLDGLMALAPPLVAVVVMYVTHRALR